MEKSWELLALSVILADLVVRLLLSVRVIAKRTPVPDTLTWLLLLLLVPIASWMLYAILGESRLGRRRAARYEALTQRFETQAAEVWRHRYMAWTSGDNDYKHLSVLATTISGLPTLAGNSVELLAHAGQYLDRLIGDIDAARHHVHLCYYIWEPDSMGERVVEACVSAAQRGVRVRVLVDSVGSAALLRHELWGRMQRAGVRCSEALPANFLRAMLERIDLRNHRKIAVIDGTVGYCGSQNITAENFRPRRGGGPGPWIDASVRVHGPGTQALAITFLRDWALDSEEDISDMTPYLPQGVARGSSVVHLVPSGPGPRPQAIHQAFMAMLYAAREEVIITTPYFVPDEGTKAALIVAALRGVEVIVVIPERSDNHIVDAACRSHIEDLLEAGVKVMTHRKGLLHSKTATIDRKLCFVGSANFDMRSFWLNFEATLFIYDDDFTGLLRFLQSSYMSDSVPLQHEAWRRRSAMRKFLDNCAQLLGPLL